MELNKSKLIGSIDLVKLIMITCDLMVYLPAIIKHKYIKIHAIIDMKKSKLIELLYYQRITLNQKSEDMQNVWRLSAYLRHNVVQRGDYIT